MLQQHFFFHPSFSFFFFHFHFFFSFFWSAEIHFQCEALAVFKSSRYTFIFCFPATVSLLLFNVVRKSTLGVQRPASSSITTVRTVPRSEWTRVLFIYIAYGVGSSYGYLQYEVGCWAYLSFLLLGLNIFHF